MSSNSVRGSLVFPLGCQLPQGAKAYLRLVNVSSMDGNSSVVAESTLENISHGINQGKKIPFIVQASDLDPHADYAIQVHVDSAGAGPEAFRIGDLLHSQSYLVITNNRPTQVEINLKKIE